jgi:hypothetical protein
MSMTAHMDRARCVTSNAASADGQLMVAPGVSLMAGTPRAADCRGWPIAADPTVDAR